jgi:hypothetical protein
MGGWKILIIAMGWLGVATWAQDVHPSQSELWEELPNGDALQKDLGFIVPKQWKVFTLRGFSSTRPDGASVKAQYRSEDQVLQLNILL